LVELEAGIAALDGLSGVQEASTDRRGALWAADTLPAAGDLPLTRSDDEIAPGEGRRGTLVIWLAMAGRFEEARALGERMMTRAPAALAARGQAGHAYADASYGLAIAYAALGSPEAARRTFGQCRDLSLQSEHYITAGYTGLVELLWAVVPYQADRPDERQRVAAEAERFWARASGAAQAPLGAQLPGMLLAGRWTEARELALSLYAVRTEVRDRPAVELARLAHHQGDVEFVDTLAREVLPAGPATEPGGSDFLTAMEVLRAQASLTIEAGDLATARTWLEAHDRWLVWSGAALGRAEGHLAWGAYHRAAGDLAFAEDHAMRALARATQPRQPLALLAAHRLLGEIATTAGRYTEAAEHLDEALALAAACEAPYERALTLLAQAGWQAATGDRAAAGLLLNEFRAVCVPLGAALALAHADALAARLSVTASRAPAGEHPAGLTRREVEVLRLVAAGKSNREIGDALFISHRTATTHVANILAKLGVASRSEATARAVRDGLV
jgi:ATP/maltotriose-dependent transcriptional regulator MalT